MLSVGESLETYVSHFSTEHEIVPETRGGLFPFDVSGQYTS